MKKIAFLLAAAAALSTGGAWAAAQSHPTHMKSTTGAASVPAKGVWNWSMIDTNKDNLIEPAEMEQFLATHPGPLKKTTTG